MQKRRSYYDCCCRALKTGMKAPLILTLPHKKYPQAELVSALGAMHELYTPLNVREEKKTKVDIIGFHALAYDQELSFEPFKIPVGEVCSNDYVF